MGESIVVKDDDKSVERDFGTNCMDCERYKKIGEVCVLEHGKNHLWEYCRDFVQQVKLPEYDELMLSLKRDMAIQRQKERERKERDRRQKQREREARKEEKRRERISRARRRYLAKLGKGKLGKAAGKHVSTKQNFGKNAKSASNKNKNAPTAASKSDRSNTKIEPKEQENALKRNRPTRTSSLHVGRKKPTRRADQSDERKGKQREIGK